MHRWILGVGWWVACATAAAGEAADSAPCPAASAGVLERFISADCADCWTRASSPAARSGEWLFDWIVPASRGDEAPLSPAAPVEAARRAQRALGSTLRDGASVDHRTPARRDRALQLHVSAGPAWHGYIGVQVESEGLPPRGASLWVALIEAVAPGTDGTPRERQLVRSVSGPLPILAGTAGEPFRRLQALRWPETAQPQRLRARAWVERDGGHILLVAQEHCTPASGSK